MKLGTVIVLTDTQHSKDLGALLLFLQDWYLKGKASIHAHTLAADNDVTFEELVHKCVSGRISSGATGQDRRPGGIYAD